MERKGSIPGGLVSEVTNIHSGRAYAVSTAPEIGRDYWSTSILPMVKRKGFFGLLSHNVLDPYHPVASFVRNNMKDAHIVHAQVRHVVISVHEDAWFDAFPWPSPPDGLSRGASMKLDEIGLKVDQPLNMGIGSPESLVSYCPLLRQFARRCVSSFHPAQLDEFAYQRLDSLVFGILLFFSYLYTDKETTGSLTKAVTTWAGKEGLELAIIMTVYVRLRGLFEDFDSIQSLEAMVSEDISNLTPEFSPIYPELITEIHSTVQKLAGL